MDKVTLKLFLTDSSELTLTQCVNFRFEKERYTPYTAVSGLFVCPYSPDKVGEVKKVAVKINTKDVHSGPVDTFRVYRSGGIDYLSFSSRGFSMALSQNNIHPGLKLSVTLETLFAESVPIPEVTFEKYSNTADFIYVKEGSSLWDAIVAFCQKTEGKYPYICDENYVKFRETIYTTVVIDPATVVSYGKGNSYSGLVSDYHMKNTDGEYAYNYINQVAADRGIVRHKYIDLDRQWLSEPDNGLSHKSKFSSRGINSTFLKHIGFQGEELRRRVEYNGVVAEASRVLVEFGKNGMFTSVWFYEDGYC